METSDDEQGQRPLLFDTEEPESKKTQIVGLLKAKKWAIVFVIAGLLAIGIVVGLVATKSSIVDCSSKTDSDKCFFTGKTRLPKILEPLTYTVRLHPNLTTFKFDGTVEIVVLCLESTRRVVFHQKDLQFSKDDITIHEVENGKLNGAVGVEEMRLDLKDEQVILKTRQLLHKNKEYAIKVTFKGNLNEKLEGFYKSSYKTKAGQIKYLATTHFEATAARQAFPCFDEPAMKANFTIILVHEKHLEALSNMPDMKKLDIGNNLTETHFEQSVKMSTYLVAFVVCDFKHVGITTANGKKVRVWTPPEEINEAELALTSANVILTHYEKYFGVAYPLPKQDLIAIPDFSAGAMENWGLITYRLTSLLVDPKESSTSNRQWVETVVAHELAHQWFGNLVTMKWWDDLWLNEGFASYVENLGVNKFQPDMKMMDQFVISNLQRSMHLDQLANSHPISVVVKNPDEISSLFDDISYHKGASLINMLNNVLHEDNFHAGLKSYLQKYKFSNAATDDLWNSLSQNASIDVKKVMDTWTLQMGFPLVTIKKEDGKYLAKQEHFLIDPEAKPAQTSPYNYKWYVPLTYVTDKGKTNSEPVWMNLGDVVLDVPVDENGWLKVNRDQKGYYRVNYPLGNWKNLAKTLQNNHKSLSPADRAGLLNDVFELARAGKVSYETALDMVSYLDKEKDYVPWRAATSGLSYIGARLSMTPYYGLYQNYILSKATPVLDELKFEDEGSPLQKYLRDMLFSTTAYYDYKPAVDKAKELFKEFMVNNASVRANFRYVVYDTGVRLGARDEWEFMWDKYQKEIVAAEKTKLLSSLSASREAWLLQRCLEYALNTSLIKSQDGDSVISSVAGNPNGRLLAWDFFRLHWATLRKRYGSEAFSFGRLVKSVTTHFQTEFHYNEVKTFFDAHPDLGSAARSLQQAYETIKSNIRWVEKYENEVIEWLRKHQPPSS
ncbi:endoplasmic reticulum aminopeptidase 1-like [Dendronephthya gigantea]|uniref:endoplasmic reticulum aminopeptidase 1-like n=1 Tax=Dendronephthya gigantea TaxID=151771 RepID=UPI00106A4436|nr:endoplasmic reticulum aminopeptidase 1-like [Dendronephthya gigantea]